MPETNNNRYYADRAAKARAMAESAADPEVAKIHHSMAESYETLAQYAADERSQVNIVDD